MAGDGLYDLVLDADAAHSLSSAQAAHHIARTAEPLGTHRNHTDRFDPAPDSTPRSDDRPVVGASSQKTTTVLAGLIAFADVILAVAANKFFDGAAWVVAVVIAGLTFVALTVVNVHEANGERIISWTRIRRIVTARIFVAIISAAVAGAATFLVMNHVAAVDNAALPVPSGSPPATATPAPTGSTSAGSIPPSDVPSSTTTTTTTSASTSSPAQPPADRCPGQPGTIPVKRQAGAPLGLKFCPALLNNGAPLDGPFTAAGKIVGSPSQLSELVIVNKANPKTCDAYGNPPDPGYYYARGMTIDAEGGWEFFDGLGYDEAVTIGRTYYFVAGSADTLDAIRTDRERHGSDGYTGMAALPGKAKIVASFYQSPGKYEGKGSPPCKG